MIFDRQRRRRKNKPLGEQASRQETNTPKSDQHKPNILDARTPENFLQHSGNAESSSSQSDDLKAPIDIERGRPEDDEEASDYLTPKAPLLHDMDMGDPVSGSPNDSLQNRRGYTGGLSANTGRKESDDPNEDGLPLEKFAEARKMSETAVWKQLRTGQLYGRSVQGELLIYELQPERNGSTSVNTEADIDQRSARYSDRLPRPPNDEISPFTQRESADLHGPLQDEKEDHAQDISKSLTLTGAVAEGGGSPEIALLLDHLSLAKEENREILRMTQESMKKVSELNDQIVAMKNDVIETKEAQIATLEQRLAQQKVELLKVRQEREDLETLNRTLSESDLAKSEVPDSSSD